MPTVLRAGGFRVIIFLPPREHEPPQSTVRSPDGEVVIELAAAGKSQRLRNAAGMRASGIAAAFWLVEEHTEMLLEQWRRYHG